jgi:alkylglycerol monooxygenase
MKNVVVIAIPAFALLMALEALWDARRKTGHYTGKDAATNIALGIGSVIFGKIIATYFIYDFFFRLSPWRVAPSWAAWAAVLLLDDFCYYWFHRISHESRLFWNMHVVHHSSDHYNLSVAVRQSWFGGAINWIFYVPICLLGFPPEMVLTAHGVNLIYQFWIHTQFVGRMGWLEYVFNCPTHHRVHHGVNDQYLDKNYGGILIIWDRLFGTFVEETERPRYGVIKPLNSYNPLWANLHAWAEMAAAMRERATLGDKLRCVFGAPAMATARAPHSGRAASPDGAA